MYLIDCCSVSADQRTFDTLTFSKRHKTLCLLGEGRFGKVTVVLRRCCSPLLFFSFQRSQNMMTVQVYRGTLNRTVPVAVKVLKLTTQREVEEFRRVRSRVSPQLSA